MRSSSICFVLASGSLSVSACGAPADQATAPTATSAPPGTATASPTGTVATTGLPNKPPTMVPQGKPLNVLVQTNDVLSLMPMRGALFVHGAGISEGGAGIFSRVDGDTLVHDERLASFSLNFGDVRGVSGTWPDDAHAIAVDSDGRTGWGVRYKWSHDHWATEGTPLERTWTFVDQTAWDKGRILGLASAWLPPDEATVKFTVVQDGDGGLHFTKGDNPKCATALRSPFSMLALDDGSVFVAGSHCNTEWNNETVAVEAWSKGAATSTLATNFTEMPGGNDAPRTLAGRAWNDVYLALGGVTKGGALYHFDGKAWTPDPLPPNAPLLAISVGKDGTLYGLEADPDGNRILARAPGGGWEERPLPAYPLAGEEVKGGATDLYADPSGDLYVTSHGALLRDRPAKNGPTKLDWKPNTQFAASITHLPRAATKSCDHLFALLYGFTKVTPDDYDFPLARKSLKGHKEFANATLVVTTEGGHKFFGAVVPDFDEGTRLVAQIKKDVTGSSPQLLCADPKVVRTMKLNIDTGEVAKDPK